MDQKSPKAAALSELRELGLTFDIAEDVAARIKAGLLVIEGLKFQGAYRSETRFLSYKHLYAAYHVIAQEIVDENTPDEVLDTVIPQIVMEWSRRKQWRPHIQNLDWAKHMLRGPIAEWQGKKLGMQAGSKHEPRLKARFPNRAGLLRQPLKAEPAVSEDRIEVVSGGDRTRRRSHKKQVESTRKGDSTLIEGKGAVNFKTAEQYLGISDRQRQNLMRTEALSVVGAGQNSKITTESLRKYLAPDNPK